MNVVIYARFSSSKQNETSIEAQLEECYKYCKSNNYNVIEKYIDRATSAKTDNRPAFQKMISDSCNKEFEAIIVYQLDRFSRSREDSAFYKHKLKKNGVKVISARETISEDASGILIESVLEGMAEYYSAELSQKVKRNLRQNAERGYFNGGKHPFGFKVVTVDCGTYKKRKLEIDVDTAPIVRDIFEMRANGTKISDILNYLNSKGCRTVQGRNFKKSSLECLFKNKRYIGTNIYENEEYPDTIPAIIDKELFERVQLVVQKFKHAPGISKASEEYILTTKIFCGQCGNSMVGTSGTSQTGTIYKYYTCNNVLKKKCNKKNVPKDVIEDAVFNECKRLLTAENIELITNKVYAICQEQNSQSCLLKSLEKQMNKLNNNIENLMVALENGENVDIISDRISQKRNELKEVKENYYVEKNKIENYTEKQIKFFLLKLKNGSIDDIKYRRTLVNAFVNKVYVYNDKIAIMLNVTNESATMNKELLSEIRSNLLKAQSSYDEVLCQPKKGITCVIPFFLIRH